MGYDRDESFEWVNAWADAAKPGGAPEPVRAQAVQAAAPMPAIVDRPVSPHPARLLIQFPPARFAAAKSDDQLARDIAEIERVRDRLAALPEAANQRTRALTIMPTRTSDAVPIVVGGVLALVMLTVFGAAAAVTKFGR